MGGQLTGILSPLWAQQMRPVWNDNKEQSLIQLPGLWRTRLFSEVCTPCRRLLWQRLPTEWLTTTQMHFPLDWQDQAPYGALGKNLSLPPPSMSWCSMTCSSLYHYHLWLCRHVAGCLPCASVSLLCVCVGVGVAKNWGQGLACAEYMLSHWASPPASPKDTSHWI